jgi:serine/threonine-protein kinase
LFPPSSPAYTKREIENLNKLKIIKGIPRVLVVGLSDTLNYVIISHEPGMDLFEHTEKYGFFSEEEVRPVVKKILKIIKNVHKNKITHKDIKPENILYDKDTENVTVIDFEGKYTNDYRSPEQVIGKNITNKTDIWSIGITIFSITTGVLPFKNAKEILTKKIPFPKKWSENFIDFMNCIFLPNGSVSEKYLVFMSFR